jgi:hypothetical protein
MRGRGQILTHLARWATLEPTTSECDRRIPWKMNYRRKSIRASQADKNNGCKRNKQNCVASEKGAYQECGVIGEIGNGPADHRTPPCWMEQVHLNLTRDISATRRFATMLHLLVFDLTGVCSFLFVARGPAFSQSQPMLKPFRSSLIADGTSYRVAVTSFQTKPGQARPGSSVRAAPVPALKSSST